MFPPAGEQVWKSDLNWQPVPIHTIDIKKDYLVYQAIPCPKFDEMREEYKTNSPELKALLKKYRTLLEYLEVNSGQKIQTILDAGTFSDPLEVELNRGFTLPDWVQKIYDSTKDTLEYFAALYFESATHTQGAKKAIAGFLIREIFDRFQNKTRSILNPDRKLWIYSGHDNTIVNTLNALGLYDVSKYYYFSPFVNTSYEF